MARAPASRIRSASGAARGGGQEAGRRPAGAARPDDLAIPGYDTLTAEQIVGRLASLSPRDRAAIETHEREHKNRTTILNRIASLRPDQPTVAAARPRAADQGPGADENLRAAGAGGAGADDAEGDASAAGTQGSGQPDPLDSTSGDPRAAAKREPDEVAGSGGVLPAAAAHGFGERGPVTATDGDRPAAAAEDARETSPVIVPGAGAPSLPPRPETVPPRSRSGSSCGRRTPTAQRPKVTCGRPQTPVTSAPRTGSACCSGSAAISTPPRRGCAGATDGPRGRTRARTAALARARKDPQAAVEWLDRAAQADDPAAERDLGILLREHGDIQGAHHWLSRAADRDGQARHALAELEAGQ